MKYFYWVLGLFLVGAPSIADADPAVALHSTEVNQSSSACGTWAPANLPCPDFNISGRLQHGYNVYLVATGSDSGYSFLSCGIEYNGNAREGLDVFDFRSCATLYFPSAGPSGYEFPASGGSARFTWSPCPDTTRESRNGVAGYFYVYAYSADVLAVIPNLNLKQGPEFVVGDCPERRLEIAFDPRAAVRFSEPGDVLGYNPCTGEGTPPPPPGQNPPPPPPLPIPDQDAGLYFHIATDGRTPRCGVVPTTIAGVVTSVPAPTDSTPYLVYLLASPKVASGYMQQFRGARFGIEYDVAQAQRGLDITGWTSCCLLNFTHDEWPSSGSGGTLVWSDECLDSLIVVLGYFWVDVHGPATLRLVGYPYYDDHIISIATCPNHVYEYESLPQSRAGWVSMGGAAIAGDADGCNPMLEPCGPGVVPAQPTTWGRIKSQYLRPGG